MALQPVGADTTTGVLPDVVEDRVTALAQAVVDTIQAADIGAATQDDITAAINNLIAAAPGALNTLDELAAALGDDANFAATVTTALAGKQPLDSDLTAIAALSTTSFGRGLLALADAAAGRTAFGLGTAATAASGDFQPVDGDLTAIAALTTTSFGRSLLTQADAVSARSTLDALGGTDITDALTEFRTDIIEPGYQPLDSDLTAIAALTTTSFGRSFLSLANAAAARTLAGWDGTVVLPSTSDITTRGLIKSRANDLSGKVTAKVVGDTADGLFNWMHDGDAGYLFHLTGGPNFTGNAIVGIGVDYAGKGLLVNNKGTGIGINLTQFATISNANAHGLYGVQNNTLASVIRLHQQVAGAASVLWMTADATATAGQKLLRWGTGASWSTNKGYIDAVSGQLVADDIAATALSVNGSTIAEYIRDTIATALVAGTNVTVTPDDAGDTITIASSGGASGVTVQDEGTPLTTSGTTLNFVGSGVTATGTGATKTITIPGGGGTALTVQDEGGALATDATTLNFTGDLITASGTGATKTINAPALLRGVPKPSGGTRLAMLPGVVATTSAAGSFGAASAHHYQPIIVSKTMTFDALIGRVSTAAGSIGRMGLYTADDDWQPVTLVIDAGTFSTASATNITCSFASPSGTVTTPPASAAVTLTPGSYVIDTMVDNVTTQMTCIRGTLPGVQNVDPSFGATPLAYRFVKGGATVSSGLPSTPALWDTIAYSSIGFQYYAALRCTAT